LEDLLPILKNDYFNFIDLQYNDTVDERKTFFNNHNLDIFKFNEIDSFNDLESMFALMQNCDLVITVSNSIAHMAGAVGKKTFVLTPFGPGKFWYWVNHDNHNLWYKNLKCFYQAQQNDWALPIDKIKEEMNRI
jgi:ADP-heptose:LPS heptosyltransferase